MRSQFSHTWYLAVSLALVACGGNTSGGGMGGAPSAGSGGKASQSGGASGNGGVGSGGHASATGGDPSTGKDAAAGASGGSGQGGSAGNGAGGATKSGGATGSGGKPGADAGLGGALGSGGAAQERDAGYRDAASSGTGGAGSGGKPGTGGATTGTGGSGTGGGTGGAETFTPCPGATQTLTVGSGQQYATVQAAVNAVSASNAKLVQISVKAGKYKEQVTINRPFVCLVGESATTTTITNALGTNILTGGTVIVTGNDFSAANIAFENTGGDGSGQAVALMAQGQRQQFRNCRFLSYQDTLYTNTGTQYFRDCYIQGDTDYIFGDATAVFEDCTMNNVAEGTAVTAPRTPQNTTYGFVFLGGQLTANPTTSSVRSNHVALGRPWGPYAAAAFINVAMGAHILADGWTTMSNNTLADTRFLEYKSTGAGANPTNATRASRQLSDAQAASYTVAKALPSWTPGYSK
jgi:pectin methylesterase-like acyl-CoA thioesterase